MSGGVVPTSTDGDFKLMDARKVEGGRDIIGAQASRNHRGPAVDEGVETAARRVVFSVARIDNRAGERPPQLVQAAFHALIHPIRQSGL